VRPIFRMSLSRSVGLFALLTDALFDECTGIGMVGESKSRGVGTMPRTGLTPRRQCLLQTRERTAWLLS
jgi:hypothetical protein